MTDTATPTVKRLAAACENQAPKGYDDSAGVSTRCGHHRLTAATIRALAVERDALLKERNALLKERNALRTGIGVIGVVLDTLRAEVRNG